MVCSSWMNGSIPRVSLIFSAGNEYEHRWIYTSFDDVYHKTANSSMRVVHLIYLLLKDAQLQEYKWIFFDMLDSGSRAVASFCQLNEV